jgi:hypothetical protein
VALTRRGLLAGAAAGALGAGGVYELVDRLAGASPRRAEARPLPAEQHLLDLGVATDNGVEVLVPPLHHRVVTATVAAGDLRRAQRDLEDALRALEERFDASTPAGLGVTVAWGLPYFRERVPEAWARHAPHDRRADRPALLDAIRFPSDFPDTRLEANEAAVLLRSDSLGHVEEGARVLFDELGVFRMTSVRKGFIGGDLPRRMALAAGIPGADLIPEGAELFLGFTSTQKAGLGPGRIANLETLGYTDARGGYFHGGTHMHLSHLYEDVETWYLNFDFRDRVATVFRPRLDVAPGTQTVRQDPRDVATERAVARDVMLTGRFGHSSSIQPSSRLQRDVLAEDGTRYPKGTAVPQRADFNTLDNPFAASARPGEVQDGPAAGLHFVVFNPTSDDFHRNRLAMDGRMPDGTRLPVPTRTRSQGFNAVLRTTHRQNFLVPPRSRRSFPLAEL